MENGGKTVVPPVYIMSPMDRRSERTKPILCLISDQDATCFNCVKHKQNVDRLMEMIQDREVYHETEMKAKRTAVDNMLKAQQEVCWISVAAGE